jgi:hypothetical protein
VEEVAGMAVNKKQTSGKAASAAGTVLTSAASTKADKEAAGSALSQTPSSVKKAPAKAKTAPSKAKK